MDVRGGSPRLEEESSPSLLPRPPNGVSSSRSTTLLDNENLPCEPDDLQTKPATGEDRSVGELYDIATLG